MDDWHLLRHVWQRCTQQAGADGHTYEQQHIQALYARGISMEDALQFLFHQRPGEDAFKSWITGRTRPRPPEASLPHTDVLSEAELHFWQQHGYLVLRNAIPRTQCLAAQTAIWEYLGASIDDPASWYQPHPGKRGLMLQFSDHPALEVNRHNARIRRAYQQLYREAGITSIYPTIDKVSFNPPETAHYQFMGSALHWDVSLQQPIPFKLQGMLYLSDCPASHGAFHCVPGFQHRIGDWLASVPPDCAPRSWAFEQLRPEAVEGQAGDFIIWHQALPHCASANLGPLPRMVQYLTYLPEQGKDQDIWI